MAHTILHNNRLPIIFIIRVLIRASIDLECIFPVHPFQHPPPDLRYVIEPEKYKLAWNYITCINFTHHGKCVNVWYFTKSIFCITIKGVWILIYNTFLDKNKLTKIRLWATETTLQKSIIHEMLLVRNNISYMININALIDTSSKSF